MKYLTIIALACFAFSCKKKQPEMIDFNQGCDCAKETSAEFLMEEMTTGNLNFAKYTNTDAIFSSKNVRFRALQSDAEYKWYIGSDIINDQTVTRYFENYLVGQTVAITLVVKKSPNLICHPNDDGYDSITRYLTIAQLPTYDFPDTTFLEGTYRMKSPLLTDSVDIKIDYRDYGLEKRIDIYNFDGNSSNCLNVIKRAGHVNYRQFWTVEETSVTQGDYLQGSCHVPLTGPVEMNFTSGGFENGVYNTELRNWLYRGRKL